MTYSYNDFTLLRESSSPDVYVVVADAKFYVQTGAYFNWDWGRIQVVYDGRLNNWFRYPRAGTLLRESSRPEVWVIAWGEIDPRYTWVSPNNRWAWVRRHVMSYEAIQRMGKDWSHVRVIPDGALDRNYIARGWDWW